MQRLVQRMIEQGLEEVWLNDIVEGLPNWAKALTWRKCNEPAGRHDMG